MSEYLILVDENGDEYEVDADDCEESEDGSGVYLLAADGEEFEDFYEYLDEDDSDDEDDSEDESDES